MAAFGFPMLRPPQFVDLPVLDAAPDAPETGRQRVYFLASGGLVQLRMIGADGGDDLVEQTPAAPSALSVTWPSIAAADVDLTWTVNASGSLTEIWRSVDGAAYVLIATTIADASSYTDSGAPAGVLSYKARAKTTGGDFSDYSPTDSVTTGAPAAPVLSYDAGTQTVSWGAVTNASGYYYEGYNDAALTSLAGAEDLGNVLSAGGVPSGAYVRVRAYNGGYGNGPWSATLAT